MVRLPDHYQLPRAVDITFVDGRTEIVITMPPMPPNGQTNVFKYSIPGVPERSDPEMSIGSYPDQGTGR